MHFKQLGIYLFNRAIKILQVFATQQLGMSISQGLIHIGIILT
jgi:hypothetical protein